MEGTGVVEFRADPSDRHVGRRLSYLIIYY